jgi:hypothetical protein
MPLRPINNYKQTMRKLLQSLWIQV